MKIDSKPIHFCIERFLDRPISTLYIDMDGAYCYRFDPTKTLSDLCSSLRKRECTYPDQFQLTEHKILINTMHQEKLAHYFKLLEDKISNPKEWVQAQNQVLKNAH